MKHLAVPHPFLRRLKIPILTFLAVCLQTTVASIQLVCTLVCVATTRKRKDKSCFHGNQEVAAALLPYCSKRCFKGFKLL